MQIRRCSNRSSRSPKNLCPSPSMVGAIRGAAFALLSLLAFPVLAASSSHPISRTEGASRVVSLAVGDWHSCALRSGGDVLCWGDDRKGQVSRVAHPGDLPGYSEATHPGPYVSISVSGDVSCALKPDGSPDCWGRDASTLMAHPPGPYQAISAGNAMACGLKTDGNVQCWGNNSYGNVGGGASFLHTDGPFLSVSTDLGIPVPCA